MMGIAGLIGGLGIICMISKKTLIGLLMGIQLLILGATLMFVLASVEAKLPVEGHAFGLLITMGGVAQLVVGYTLSIRLFLVKKNQLSLSQDPQGEVYD